jgi:hypothetical protein
MHLTDARIAAMDPAMLMSIVNMKLRNEYKSLDSLGRGLDIDTELLRQKLEAAGFRYLAEVNQFR